MTIDSHRQLLLLLRFGLLFGGGLVLYLTQPPGLWGLAAFIALGVMVFVGATAIAMRIPARCAQPGCRGSAHLTRLQDHHWYVCSACGDRRDGGSQQDGTDP